MTLAARERLYRERNFVPVRILRFEIMVDPVDGNEYVRSLFRHPCPCEGWKLDKVFYTSMLVPPIDKARLKYTPDYFKYTKDMIRKEARIHVYEFFKYGTIDGEKR